MTITMPISYLLLKQDPQVNLNADIAPRGSDMAAECHWNLALEQLFGERGHDIPAHGV